MSCPGGSNCTCGCCAGASVQTPQVKLNRAGLPAISYRVGSWPTFKESMLARLSSSDYPALNALKTRDDDDFTIAFIDATSVMLDILSFYQERLANESYLRTATQLQSLIELSRLIGYTPVPGTAAACYVAFSLQTAPGQAPDPTAPAIIIPHGTQMQSVPAQGQTPQTFETSADIPAKPDWNALPVQSAQPWEPASTDQYVYLQGTATQLQSGDLVLIVGDERTGNPGDPHWDVRLVTTVTPDTPNKRTYVEWSERLGGGSIGPAQKHPKFYAFRQRAALFGYNAVSPVMLSKKTLGQLQDANLVTSPPKGTAPEWIFSAPSTTAPLIDLDGVYSKIVTGGWIALIRPDAENTRTPAGFVTLHQVQSITAITRSDYAVSAKISRATADTTVADLNPYYAVTRQSSAAVQSEELAVAPKPLIYPLYGTTIHLEDLRPDLAQTTVVAITGPRQKLSLQATPDVIKGTLQFVPDDDPSNPLTLNPGDVVIVTDPTPLPPPTDANWQSGASVKLNVQDASGRPGTVQGPLADFLLTPSTDKDPQVSECAAVTVSTTTDPYPHTVLTLQSNSALQNCYDRTLTTVNANVALATNGQSVSEIMGSGSASTPNQSFTLKQWPVTYIQAPTPTGRQSTLQVPVNGVNWTEVPTLYQQPPSATVYATLTGSDTKTEVIFGDGVEGATLPTGQNNVQANYRIGSGSASNIAAGALTTLIDRPLGVSGVTNPQPATGGQDPQSINDVRANAPQTVLTLGRAVSITDYQSYAATFAGIAKAYAIWIPAGPSRGVFLTVAGVNGADLTGSPTLANLVASLQSFGNPLVPITVVSFLETLFGLSAELLYDPAYDQPTVQAQVRQTLAQTYSFANRSFGQGVSVDEVATVIQGVSGVVAVNVTNLGLLQTSTAGDLASQGGAFILSKLATWLTNQVLTPPRPGVPGVVAINVTNLGPLQTSTAGDLASQGGAFTLPKLANWLPKVPTQAPPASPTRICPYLPVPSLTSQPSAAEILVLSPDPSQVTLEVMS